MDLSSTKKTAFDYFKQHSLLDNIFLLYTFVLIILLIALPVFQIWSLQSTIIEKYTFFWSHMWESSVLIIIMLLFMLAWNLSSEVKKGVYQLVWFRSSNTLINSFCLLTLVLTFFSVKWTIVLYASNFSQKVSLASSYYIILLYLIGWLLLSLWISYRNTKKSLKYDAEDIHVPKEEDITSSEAFKKVEQEFEWLFKNDKEMS